MFSTKLYHHKSLVVITRGNVPTSYPPSNRHEHAEKELLVWIAIQRHALVARVFELLVYCVILYIGQFHSCIFYVCQSLNLIKKHTFTYLIPHYFYITFRYWRFSNSHVKGSL